MDDHTIPCVPTDDYEIPCATCREPFLFPVGEQEWFAAGNWPHPVAVKPAVSGAESCASRLWPVASER